MPSLMQIAGICLAFSIVSSLTVGLFELPDAVPGLLQLAAGMMFWSKVPPGVKRISLILVISGAIAITVSPHHVSLLDVISKNQQLIAMLAAIGLLRYSPQPEAVTSTPQGPSALWQTLFGLHWFASVINLSSLVIFSDRLADSERRLKGFQGMMLSRAFSLAALWSPFFVAMGVALAYAPGADYRILLLWGLPFSQFLLAGMIWQAVKFKPNEVSNFRGFSFKLSALVPIAGLAIGVILFHQLLPGQSIPTIITLLAPCYPLLANLKNKPGALLKRYVTEDLSQMGAETVLFVSSGVLGTGLSVLVTGQAFKQVSEFSPWFLVCAGLAIILVAASVGIHPVVGVTVVGGVLSNIQIPPNLLALSFLFGWGLGVLINPLSGVHILLSGRYAYPSNKIWRWNFSFVASAFFAACGWFWLYTQLSV